MAEQAVFTLLQQGGSAAVDEAKYLLGVSDKLVSAKNQLKNMQVFLRDVDERMTRGNGIAKNLVSEVREVAYEVEDIIDCANILKRQSDPKISFTGFLCKYAFFPGYLIRLHKLGGRLDAANGRIHTIFDEFQKQKIASNGIIEDPRRYISEHDNAIKHFRSVHPDYSDEIDVIGFDDQIRNIKDDLMDTGNRLLTVVSIVGPGGAGKSTMAKKVYGCAEIRNHFDVCAWITISQNSVHHDLSKEMVKRLVPHRFVQKIINDEESAKIKEEKEVKELERLVSDNNLLEEVIDNVMKNETAEEHVKTSKQKHKHIRLHLLEEKIKLAVVDWKASEEQTKEQKLRILLQEYINRIMEKSKRVELDDLKEEQLENLLRNFALSETYLIVLDDIWRIDAWNTIRDAFPDRKNGSRIILTTRNENVAQYPDAKKKIYKPKLLNQDESTKLFLKKALPEHILDGWDSHLVMGQKLDELKELGKDLAAKCCGLPLAIVVLGGHLSRNPDVAEWKRLTSSMDWHALIATDRVIGSILDLSYYDMPSHLRACFLYITAFPEDYIIDVQVLVALWVAEGFIPLERGQTREDLATKYVDELAQRCMVQVEKRTSSGRIKVIKMHDILRDWGIGLARREGLIKDCHNAEDIDATYADEIMKSYRVVLHGSKIGTSLREFRTLLDFASCFKNPKVQVKKSFQSLRVLYLDCSGRVSLPREIGRMRYLRHLGLGGNCLYYLPSSIGDLLSLETMQATASINHIPGSLWQIRTLRQVHVPNARSLSVPRISAHSKVEVVVFSFADKWNRPPDAGLLPTHIADAERIMEATKRQVLKTPNLSCCCGIWYGSNGLDIIGRYKGGSQFTCRVPDFEEMHKIALLKICCENLLSNDQKILEMGRMRFLKALEIGEGSYTGTVFTCLSGSFPQLQRLVLHDLALKHWKMEQGSLPCLTEVTLCKCRNLTYLPEGLSDLWLCKLDLIAMPSGLYQQSRVAQELEQKGCVIYVTSDEKYFHHLNVPFLCS